MSKNLEIAADIGKMLAVNFSAVLVAAGVFGFFCIFIFQAPFSVIGCGAGLALGLLLWGWACFRSEEPALRTFVTLLLQSGLIFLPFSGASLLPSCCGMMTSLPPGTPPPWRLPPRSSGTCAARWSGGTRRKIEP